MYPSNPQCTGDMCDNGEHFWLYICSDGWQQGGKGDITWQFSCIHETLVGSLGLGNLGWTKVTYVVYPCR